MCIGQTVNVCNYVLPYAVYCMEMKVEWLDDLQADRRDSASAYTYQRLVAHNVIAQDPQQNDRRLHKIRMITANKLLDVHTGM